MFAGGEDDYDEPDTCQKFIDSLPEGARSHVSLKYYPKATHGWDSQERAKVFHDDSAWLGRGGKVRITRRLHQLFQKSQTFLLTAPRNCLDGRSRPPRLDIHSKAARVQTRLK